MLTSSYVFNPVIPLSPIGDDDEDEWVPSSNSNTTSPSSTITTATTPGTTDSDNSWSNDRKRKRPRSRNFFLSEKQGLYEIVSKYKESKSTGDLGHLTKITWKVISNEFHLRFATSPKRSIEVLKGCWASMCRSGSYDITSRRPYTIFRTPKTNAVEIRVDTGMAYQHFCEEDIEIYTGKNAPSMEMYVLPDSPAPIFTQSFGSGQSQSQKSKENRNVSRDPLQTPFQPIGIPCHVPSFCDPNQQGKMKPKVNGPKAPTPPYKCRQRKVPPGNEEIPPASNPKKPDTSTITMNTSGQKFPSTVGLPDLTKFTKGNNANIRKAHPISRVKYFVTPQCGSSTAKPNDAPVSSVGSQPLAPLRKRGRPPSHPEKPQDAPQRFILANWRGRISIRPVPSLQALSPPTVSESKSKSNTNAPTTGTKPLPHQAQAISKSKENCPTSTIAGPKPTPVEPANANLAESVKNRRIQLFLKAQHDLQRLKEQMAHFQRKPTTNVQPQQKSQ